MSKNPGPRPSRRRFLAASAGAAALGSTGPASTVLSAQNAAPAGDDITLVLINGRIHTMDAANTVATSVTHSQRPVRWLSAARRPRPDLACGSSICAAAR